MRKVFLDISRYKPKLLTLEMVEDLIDEINHKTARLESKGGEK